MNVLKDEGKHTFQPFRVRRDNPAFGRFVPLSRFEYICSGSRPYIEKMLKKLSASTQVEYLIVEKAFT